MPDGAPLEVGGLQRHDMVTLAPARAAEVAAQCAETEDRDAIAHWIAAKWPMVVRMQPPGARATGRLAVGAPLPPSQGRRRLALCVDAEQIAGVAPPPRLDDIVEALPSGLREALRELGLRVAAAGVALRVFGSMAWQALTGVSYLTATSDLDVLWTPAGQRELDDGVALLAAWQAASRVPLDGEIVFGTRAVSLREWQKAQPGAHLLVKNLHGVALCTRSELIRSLAAAGEHAAAR